MSRINKDISSTVDIAAKPVVVSHLKHNSQLDHKVEAHGLRDMGTETLHKDLRQWHVRKAGLCLQIKG